MRRQFLPQDCIYCRWCRTLIAVIGDYNMIVPALVPGGIFSRVFNVEVSEDVNHHHIVDGNTVANTYCFQCRMLLGWQFIAVPQPFMYIREGSFYMRLHKLCFWNNLPLLHLNGEQDLVANEENADHDLDANEQNADQNGDAYELNADQEGNANEQIPNEQDLGANEQNADQDGHANEQVPNEQDLGANEQNADQDGDANEQVPNEEDVDANEQNSDKDGGGNGQNHDQDEGAPMKRRKV